MTTEINDTIERYTISGTGPYTFSFRIFDEDDLTVTALAVGGVDPVTLIVNTNYTVSGINDEDGGSITLIGGAQTTYAGYTLDIRSNTPLEQPTSIKNQGTFAPIVHEKAFDRLSRQVQDIYRQVKQSFRYPDNVNLDGKMANRSTWLAKYLYVNAAGEIEPASSITGGVLSQSTFDALLPTTTAVLPSSQVKYDTTPAETAQSVTPAFYFYSPRPKYDMSRVLVGENGIDNSDAVQSVYRMMQYYGGEMVFPCGDWAFYLDITSIAAASSKQVIINGQGSIFRPYSLTPTNSAVIWGDDTAWTWNDPRTWIINAQIMAKKYSGGAANGDLQYAMYQKDSCIHADNVYFMYGKTAGYYGRYVQYSQFTGQCKFLNCVDNAGSVGCYIDSNGAGSSSNEILFERPWFGSNKNGLYIRGGAQNRIQNPTVMGNSGGTLETTGGGIILAADSTGYGVEGTNIIQGWFEGNDVPHINGQTNVNTRVARSFFAPSGHPSVISFAQTYGATFEDNEEYGGACTATFSHTDNSNDAALTWRGGNFLPVVNFTNTGKRYVDIQSAPKRSRRNDNILTTTGQTGLNSVPLVQTEQYGFKTGVARTVSTSLFSIQMEAFGTTYEPVVIFELQLHVWQDNAAAGDYGYCSRIERFPITINSVSGTTAAYVGTSEGGYDVSNSAPFRTIGAIAVTVGVVGGLITVSASYPGAGTNAAGITTATFGYTIKAMGANPFTINRL